MTLAEKIRKARETEVVADGRKFVICRPTDEQALGFGKLTMLDVVKKFVIGWELKEIDLIPGGDDVPAKFDTELFSEWVSDHPEVWDELGNNILEAYKSHVSKRDSSVKN